MTEQNLYRPSRSYNLVLHIKGENYTNDLSSVRLTSSLATGYQIVTLTINITPQTIMLNQLYGQDEIKLVINKLDEDEYNTETLEFDLMIINSDFQVPVSDMGTVKDTQRDRTHYKLVTVTRLPFQIMTSLVGVVFGPTRPETVWTAPKTVKEMIETIISEKVDPQPTLKYDDEDANPDKISQCCIPPTTFMDAIKFLDRNYGIYNGIAAVFCNYDSTLNFINLTKKIKKNYDIYVEHLTNQYKNEDIEKSLTDKKYFYTYDNLQTTYTGNSKFGQLGEKINHVVLPSDELYYTIKHSLSALSNKFGIIGGTSTKPKVFINTSVAKRTKYYIENNGNDRSEVFAISKIARQISNISRMSFQIERNLPIENLINIGQVVKVGTKTTDHQDVVGKYILFSSDLMWNKEGDWETVARLELIRTNKTIFEG